LVTLICVFLWCGRFKIEISRRQKLGLSHLCKTLQLLLPWERVLHMIRPFIEYTGTHMTSIQGVGWMNRSVQEIQNRNILSPNAKSLPFVSFVTSTVGSGKGAAHVVSIHWVCRHQYVFYPMGRTNKLVGARGSKLGCSVGSFYCCDGKSC
jgi:hypothetical protein